MLTLTGTLRQTSNLTIKEKPFVKLWVEHESPRDNGPGDLQILELLLPAEICTPVPTSGKPVSVNVRAYPAGRGIGFAALSLATPLTPPAASEGAKKAS